MDNPRLLTLEEVSAACNKAMEASNMASVLLAVRDAQDAKTAAQVEAATLRAVGEALDKAERIGFNLIGETPAHGIVISETAIEALRAGKKPEGWEGR